MGNKFITSPNSFARTVVVHEEQAFIVEFKIDVAAVDERESASSAEPDGPPPHFDIEYRLSAIVQPASTGSAPTTLPIAFSPRRSLIVAGRDGRAYETELDALVTEAQLHKPHDLLTGMPTATASFKWGQSSVKRATASENTPEDVFDCVYCGHEHPRSFRSDEHVVPRALLNSAYVLRGTCNTLNQYFSHAFEKRVLQLPLIQELLLMFNPPKKLVFRERTPTANGGELVRWMHEGKSEFGGMPEYSETDKCTVSITTANGDTLPITIRLPFLIVGSVQGLGRLLEVPDRRVERDRRRVTEYLRALEADPESNADLAQALDENGGRFVAPRQVRMERSQGADHPEPHLAETTIPLVGDDELLTKLLYKIAWTHAARQLGRGSLMSGPFGRGMLEFLRSEHVIDNTIAAHTRALFTKPVTVQGVEYVFWKSDLETTVRDVEAIGDGLQRETLDRLLAYRRHRAAFIRPYIHMEPVPPFDDALRASLPERRFHELSLRTAEPDSRRFTVCDIVLFGGIVRASVPLSEEPLAEAYPQATRILF